MSENIIVLDFDGVIADSFHIALEVNRLQRPTITEEKYRSMFNTNINDAKHDDPVVREIDFFTEFGKRFASLDIDDLVKKELQNLSNTYQLFIISSTINSVIDEYLERHGIRDCFAEILGADVATSKVKKFEMLYENESFTPQKTAFLTDTSGDVVEAKKVNIGLVVGILGGYQYRETLEKSEPDAIVKDMSGFATLIEQYFDTNS